MATSGSTDFSVTRDDIVKEALELLGVLNAGDSPTSADLTTASRSLNMMIKAWQVDGLNVFSVKRSYLFLEKDQHEYTLSSSGDHYTYSYTKTTVDGDVASGAGSLDLTDATGFSNGDHIGVYQDDGTMLWTTGTVSGSTITLGSNTSAAVTDLNTVYFYTSKADSPESIIECSLRNDSLNERPIDIISRNEWASLSNKTYDGSTVEVFFEEKVSNPVLHVWPEATDPRDLLVMWIKRTREDFDAAGDTPDFPQRWYLPLAYNLAVLIGPKFGSAATNPNYRAIEKQAEKWYEKAQDYDSAPESNIWFEPDYQ